MARLIQPPPPLPAVPLLAERLRAKAARDEKFWRYAPAAILLGGLAVLGMGVLIGRATVWTDEHEWTVGHDRATRAATNSIPTPAAGAEDRIALATAQQEFVTTIEWVTKLDAAFELAAYAGTAPLSPGGTLRDPWGTPITVDQDPKLEGFCRLWSAGPDQRWSTPDDIRTGIVPEPLP